MKILTSSWNLHDPIRMLTITAINLCDETQGEQLSLFGSDTRSREQGEKVERTMDDIRAKFGEKAITFGRILNNDLGVDVKDHSK